MAAAAAAAAVPAAAAAPQQTAWATQPRQRCRLFEPLPIRTSLPGLKSVEENMQEQVRFVYTEIQSDMDLLHEQMMQEVYDSVSQELKAVAHRLASMKGELSVEMEGIRKQILEVRSDANAWKPYREQDLKETKHFAEGLVEAASSRVSEDLHRTVAQLASALRGEWQERTATVTSDLEKVRDELCSQLDSKKLADSQDSATFQSSLDEKFRAMEAELQKIRNEAEEDRCIQAKVKALEALLEDQKTANSNSLEQLGTTLAGEAQLSEARFREAQEAVAALEERQRQSLEKAMASSKGTVDETSLRHQYELETMRKALAADLSSGLQEQRTQLEAVAEKCKQDVDFAMTSLSRRVNWTAEIDLDVLRETGAYDLTGLPFAAAGLRPLQLSLRLQRQSSSGTPSLSSRGLLEGRGSTWSVGAFLTAPHGTLSFRLAIAGRSLSFDGDFATLPEWGSTKIAILERVPPKLAVELEILNVSAPVIASLPPQMTASLDIENAAEVAKKETAMLRASMVRRVEWRVGRVSQRIAEAKDASLTVGDDEALKPLLSPPFAAAGYENLQLQLYPLGYRARNDEATCGFFLVCPKGLYVKCKAFVGDQVRVIEHHYDTREPFGRGNFCRLAEKIDADDSVLCGIEILEIRQETTAQVRGGPFGNISDQLKLVSSPSISSMDLVRELRELPPKGAVPKAKGKAAATTTRRLSKNGEIFRATMPNMGETLSDSKSLPSLLPQVPGYYVANFAAGYPVSPDPKPLDRTRAAR